MTNLRLRIDLERLLEVLQRLAVDAPLDQVLGLLHEHLVPGFHRGPAAAVAAAAAGRRGRAAAFHLEAGALHDALEVEVPNADGDVAVGVDIAEVDGVFYGLIKKIYYIK